MEINQNTGVIAIVIDSADMGNPLVKTMPTMLQRLIDSAGINGRVVLPEAVHVDDDSNVAMSRNIDHLNDGPQAADEGPSCSHCADEVPMTLLDMVNSNSDSAEILIEFCKLDSQFIKAGISLESRYSPPGVPLPEHFLFNRSCWASEAEAGETVAGYWQWAEEQVKIVMRAAFDEGYISAEDTEVVIQP